MHGLGGRFIGYLIVAYRLKSLFSIEWWRGYSNVWPIITYFEIETSSKFRCLSQTSVIWTGVANSGSPLSISAQRPWTEGWVWSTVSHARPEHTRVWQTYSNNFYTVKWGEIGLCWRNAPMSWFPNVQKYNRTPLIRKLVIRNSNYPYRIGSSDEFIENSTKLNCREVTGYRINHSTVLWLLELQVRRGLKV